MSVTLPAANVCLALLVGLPGCGKSTLAQFIKHHFPKKQEVLGTCSLNLIHICYDKYISTEQAYCCISDPDNGTWKEARQEILNVVEELVIKLKELKTEEGSNTLNLKFSTKSKFLKRDFEWDIPVKRQTVIVIDDNMYYSSMRYSYFQLAKRLTIGFCQIYIECSLASALSFNKCRSKLEQIPEDIIKKMSKRLEPPNKPWEHCSETILAHMPLDDEVTFTKITNVISEALLKPVQPIEDSPALGEVLQQACTPSLLHQADLGLRQVVSDRVKCFKTSADHHEIRLFSQSLRKARTDLLQAIRTGDIVIPEEIHVSVQLDNPLAAVQLKSFLASLIP